MEFELNLEEQTCMHACSVSKSCTSLCYPVDYIYIHAYMQLTTTQPYRASLVAQSVKNPPAMQKTWVHFLGREDPLEKEMATCFSIPPWRIPWIEEPERLQSMGSQESENELATKPPHYSAVQKL